MLSRNAAQRRDSILEVFLLSELDTEWVHMNQASTDVLLKTYFAKIFFGRCDSVSFSCISVKYKRINHRFWNSRGRVLLVRLSMVASLWGEKVSSIIRTNAEKCRSAAHGSRFLCFPMMFSMASSFWQGANLGVPPQAGGKQPAAGGAGWIVSTKLQECQWSEWVFDFTWFGARWSHGPHIPNRMYFRGASTAGANFDLLSCVCAGAAKPQKRQRFFRSASAQRRATLWEEEKETQSQPGASIIRQYNRHAFRHHPSTVVLLIRCLLENVLWARQMTSMELFGRITEISASVSYAWQRKCISAFCTSPSDDSLPIKMLFLNSKIVGNRSALYAGCYNSAL